MVAALEALVAAPTLLAAAPGALVTDTVEPTAARARPWATVVLPARTVTHTVEDGLLQLAASRNGLQTKSK